MRQKIPVINNFGVLVFLLVSNTVIGQVSFSKDIAPIIKNHCLSCHHQNGVGPFALETYEQACKNSNLMEYVVTNHTMPPWSLDTNEHLFKNERILSSAEINTIKTWISNAMPVGNGKPVKLKYVAPARETGKPDLIIKFPRPYRIKGNNKDFFLTYLQRIDLGEDKYLSKIEIVPGNKKILHHCRVDFDTTNFLWTPDVDKDGFIETFSLPVDPKIPALSFVGDYVPGIKPFEYPKWCGLKLYRKMTIMVNLHYSPISISDYDQTEIHLYFCSKKPEREVFNYSHLIPSDFAAYIPKDSVYCFKVQSAPMWEDISLVAIQPHMHMLGRTMHIYAITPANDTIDLCSVDKWDFYEQENYYYKRLIKIPAGSIFEVYACYDNTSKNPKNPFFPVQDVYFNEGMTTQNEMLQFYIQYLKFATGDEQKNVSAE